MRALSVTLIVAASQAIELAQELFPGDEQHNADNVDDDGGENSGQPVIPFATSQDDCPISDNPLFHYEYTGNLIEQYPIYNPRACTCFLVLDFEF